MQSVSLEEEHRVQYFPEANLYGIKPTKALPWKIQAASRLHTKKTAQRQHCKKYQREPPSSAQFRVDYDADTFYAASLIELNGADQGKTVILKYKGTGSIVKNGYIFK